MKLDKPYEEDGRWWQNVLEFSREDREPKGTQWKSKYGWRDVSLPGLFFSIVDTYRVPYQGDSMKLTQFSLKPSAFEPELTVADIPDLQLFSVDNRAYFKYNGVCYHWMSNGCISPISVLRQAKATPLNYVVEVL